MPDPALHSHPQVSPSLCSRAEQVTSLTRIWLCRKVLPSARAEAALCLQPPPSPAGRPSEPRGPCFPHPLKTQASPEPSVPPPASPWHLPALPDSRGALSLVSVCVSVCLCVSERSLSLLTHFHVLLVPLSFMSPSSGHVYSLCSFSSPTFNTKDKPGAHLTTRPPGKPRTAACPCRSPSRLGRPSPWGPHARAPAFIWALEADELTSRAPGQPLPCSGTVTKPSRGGASLKWGSSCL